VPPAPAPNLVNCHSLSFSLDNHSTPRHVEILFYDRSGVKYEFVSNNGADPRVNATLRNLAQTWPVINIKFTADDQRQILVVQEPPHA